MLNENVHTYCPELYYFFDSEDFNEKKFLKSVMVVAKTVGQWCDYYSMGGFIHKGYAGCLITTKKIKTKGKLPSDKKEKEAFLQELVELIAYQNKTVDIFLLFLGDKSVLTNKPISPKFDHHDDTCCWVLRLTKHEFKQLQSNLKKNGLPEDLFYENSKAKDIPYKPKTVLGKLFQTFIKASRGYTPKQWEIEQKSHTSNTHFRKT